MSNLLRKIACFLVAIIGFGTIANISYAVPYQNIFHSSGDAVKSRYAPRNEKAKVYVRKPRAKKNAIAQRKAKKVVRKKRKVSKARVKTRKLVKRTAKRKVSRKVKKVRKYRLAKKKPFAKKRAKSKLSKKVKSKKKVIRQAKRVTKKVRKKVVRKIRPAKAKVRMVKNLRKSAKVKVSAKIQKPVMRKTALQKVRRTSTHIKKVALGGKVSGRSRFSSLIAKHASKYGVPVSLAHAVVRIESNYRPGVRGQAGEIGLMQIKPATARMMGFRGNAQALYNPDTNLKYGMKYLAGAYKRAGGTICGTVLRYNAGHAAKRMNPISANYCRKAKRILGKRTRAQSL